MSFEKYIKDELRQRQTGHVDRTVLNDRYTRNQPEHRAAYYQHSFLAPNVDDNLDITQLLKH